MSFDLSEYKIDINIVNKILEIIESNYTIPEPDYYPEVNNEDGTITVCSFLKNDRKKYRNYEATKIDNHILKLLKSSTDRRIVKSELCALVFILQNLKNNNSNLYNYAFNPLNRENFSNIKIFLYDLYYETFLNRNLVNLLRRKNLLQIQIDQDTENKIVELKKNILNKNFKEIYIKDIFYIKNAFNDNIPTIFHLLLKNELDDKEINIINNIYDYLIELDYFVPNNDFNIRKNNLKNFLKDLNTNQCTIVIEDDNVLGDKFIDYTFDKILSYKIFDGYCFKAEYLLNMIIGLRGNLNLKGLILTENIKYDIIDLCNINYKNKSLVDFNELLATYKPYEIELLENNNILKNNKLTSENLLPFLKFMLFEYQSILEEKYVEDIAFSTSNTLFDLIGLMGYILISDDISVFDNDGTNFHISQYCIGEFLNFLEYTKTVTLENGQNLFELINKLTFNNDNLGSIIKDMETTCIHGIGNRFLKFYLYTYEVSQRYVEKKLIEAKTLYQSESNNNSKKLNSYFPLIENTLDIDEFEDSLKSIFKLLPFFMFDEKDGYYFAVNYELNNKVFNAVNNPNNRNTLIGLFNKNNKAMVWKYNVYTNDTHSLPTNYEMKDYFYKFTEITNADLRSNITPKQLLTDNSYKYFSEKYFSNQNNSNKLLNLLISPFKFQKNRKITFKVFVSYVKEVINLLNTTKNNNFYKNIKNYAKNNMTAIVPKYLTIIEQQEDSKINFYNSLKNSNNSNNSNKLNTYFIGNLEELLSISYSQPENMDENVIIKSSKGNLRNIKRSYEYAKLLGNILLHENTNVFIPDLFNKNLTTSYEENEKLYEKNKEFFKNLYKNDLSNLEFYYQALYNSSSIIRNNIFKSINLKLDINNNEYIINVGSRNQSLSVYFMKNTSQKDRALEEIYKIISSINLVNVVTNIEKLNNLLLKYEKKHLTEINYKNIVNLIEELKLRIRVIYIVTYIYFFIIIPATNHDLNYTQNIIVKRLKYYFDNHLLEITDDSFYIQTIFTWLSCINNEFNSNVPSSYKYSIQELSKDIFMLKQISKKLNSFKIETTNSNINIINKSLKRNENIEKLYYNYNFTIDYLNKNIFYYKENPDIALKLNDYQDSIPLRFELLLKSIIVDKHSIMMIFWNQFEKLVDIIMNNENMNIINNSIQKIIPLGNNSYKSLISDNKNFHHFIIDYFSKNEIVKQNRDDKLSKIFAELLEEYDLSSNN